jgi:hypothetical protein
VGLRTRPNRPHPDHGASFMHPDGPVRRAVGADQNGYYKDEGLAVTFMESTGPAGGQVDSLSSGKAQFVIAPADVLLIQRSQGKGVTVAAVDYRRSARAYVALADSGITCSQDFVGKTISVNKDGEPGPCLRFGWASATAAGSGSSPSPARVPLSTSLCPPRRKAVDLLLTDIVLPPAQEGLNLPRTGDTTAI